MFEYQKTGLQALPEELIKISEMILNGVEMPTKKLNENRVLVGNPVRVSEIPEEAQLVMDSQDTDAIKFYFGNDEKVDQFDGFFVIVGDGDYEKVWGFYGHVPTLDRLAFPISLGNITENTHSSKKYIREASVETGSLGTDPTAEEMRAALEPMARALEADDFDIEGAIYWFANDWHGGQTSNLYSALSTSEFRPGPSVNGPETETEKALYDELEALTGLITKKEITEAVEMSGDEKEELYNTWINGNISDAKEKVSKMTQGQFLDFIEFCRGQGTMPYKLRSLVEGTKFDTKPLHEETDSLIEDPKYGKIVVHYEYPPIPDRNFDWLAYIEGNAEDQNYGWGKTKEIAIAALKERLDEILDEDIKNYTKQSRPPTSRTGRELLNAYKIIRNEHDVTPWDAIKRVAATHRMDVDAVAGLINRAMLDDDLAKSIRTEA